MEAAIKPWHPASAAQRDELTALMAKPGTLPRQRCYDLTKRIQHEYFTHREAVEALDVLRANVAAFAVRMDYIQATHTPHPPLA